MTFYNGNIIGNSSHTMEIGDITNGAKKELEQLRVVNVILVIPLHLISWVSLKVQLISLVM